MLWIIPDSTANVGYAIKERKAMLDIDWLRKICLALPGATEQIQWGNDLLFKVGGKMFAVAPLEPAPDLPAASAWDHTRARRVTKSTGGGTPSTAWSVGWIAMSAL